MAVLTDKDDLLFSTVGRIGTPTGNIFIDRTDPVNPTIELISAAEVAQINYGSGLEANRLDASDGVTMQAIYGAIGDFRVADETERQYLKPTEGLFKFAGAYDLINNTIFSTATDLGLVRSSGVRYLREGTGAISRIYFGPKSLGNIDAGSQPYYQTASLGTATDFGFTGPVDELVQVFGDNTVVDSNANTDTGAGSSDVRSFHAISVRSWGNIHDRKDLSDSGLTVADVFSGGFGLAESPHPTTGTYTEVNVITTPIAPWSTMSYLTEITPVSRTGFNEADGNFAESIENPAGGTLDEVVAFMDGLARSTADIDDGTPSQIGKQVDTLYTFDTQGNIVLKQGLFIENLPGGDLIRLRLTDDLGNPKTFPTLFTVTVEISAAAQADINAWYHAFIEDDTDTDDYNTAAAITASDKDSVLIKGTVSAATSIAFDLNYSAIPIGTNIVASTPYVIRFIVGGDPDTVGGPVENFILVTIDGTSKTVSLSNAIEQNV